MHVLVEDVMYVSQGGLLMSGGCAVYQLSWAWCLILPCSLVNQKEPQITCSEASLKNYQPQSMAVTFYWLV